MKTLKMQYNIRKLGWYLSKANAHIYIQYNFWAKIFANVVSISNHFKLPWILKFIAYSARIICHCKCLTAETPSL